MDCDFGRISKEDSILVVVDVQEKFEAVIHEWDYMLENIIKIIRGFSAMELPIIVTEQYPRGLGKTVREVSEALGEFSPVEKTCFSCMGEPEFREKLKSFGRKNIILCGIESHVCLLNTTLDAIAEGYNVHFIVDAISSRKAVDHGITVERVNQAGAFLASAEMVLFQLLKDAKSDEFKKVSRIVR
ncbi:MAG: hydrolase [Candidatus Altiarchaeota archaeon]